MSARRLITVALTAGGLAFSAALVAQQTPPEHEPPRQPPEPPQQQEREDPGTQEASAYAEALPDQFPGDTWSLDQIPGDTWSSRQLQALEEREVTTVGDFIQADPQLVGRIMGLNPREVQRLQGEMRNRLEDEQRGAPP